MYQASSIVPTSFLELHNAIMSRTPSYITSSNPEIFIGGRHVET
jgi:hypothetical protein